MAFDLPARSAWLWRAPPPASPIRSALLRVLWLAGAALLVWTGAIHLHLWAEGYGQIPTNGPLFLLDAVVGFGGALTLLAWPRPLVGLVGAGYLASTLGALVISLSVGLFGFKESLSASFVAESLVLEPVGATALVVWAWLSRSRRRPALPS